MQCSSQDLRALTRHWMWAPAVKAKCSLNCWITREFPGVIFKHISPSTRWKRILPAVPLPLPLLTYLFLIMVLAFLLGHHLWAVYDNHYLVWYSPVWRSWGHVLCSLLSRVQLFVIPRTVTQQTLSLGFSRQEYWSGLPFPPPGDLPNPGVNPMSPTLAGRFFTKSPASWNFVFSYTKWKWICSQRGWVAPDY